MRKRLVVASVVTSMLTAVGVPVAAVAVAGPTCNVGPAGDYALIQDAVNDVNCATITVVAGAYAENVTVNRPLTLKGARANKNVDSRTFGAPTESTVTGLLTIQSADVRVDGFSLTNPGQGLGVIIKVAGNNAIIKNNIVDGVGSPTFADNTVGVYLEYGPDNVRVEKNRINNVQSGPVGSAQGILIGDSTSADPSLGIRITGNAITNMTSGAKGAYGVQINNGSKTPIQLPTATGYTTVKIRENTISGLTGNWAHAIGLEGDTPNAVVSKNTISGLTDTNPVPVADVMAVNFEANSFFFTARVTRNNLAVSGAGIFVNPTLTTLYPTLMLDGTCNWWGDKSGPQGVLGATATGTGSAVSLGVDFKPWARNDSKNGWCGWFDKGDDDNHHWKNDD